MSSTSNINVVTGTECKSDDMGMESQTVSTSADGNDTTYTTERMKAGDVRLRSSRVLEFPLLPEHIFLTYFNINIDICDIQKNLPMFVSLTKSSGSAHQHTNRQPPPCQQSTTATMEKSLGR